MSLEEELNTRLNLSRETDRQTLMDGYRHIPIFIDRKTDRYRYPYWERKKRRRRRLGRGGGKERRRLLKRYF